MFQHFRSVEKPIPCDPSRSKVRSIRQHAEVGDEPSPFCPEDDREDCRNHHSQNRAAPERDEWMRVRLEEAVRQVPRKQIRIGQRPAASPAAKDVA